MINTVLGQVSVISNDMVFSVKLAVIHWQNGFVLLYFCTLRRFRAFLCEFNRQFLKKSMFFLLNTVLGQVSVIANNMVFLKN